MPVWVGVVHRETDLPGAPMTLLILAGLTACNDFELVPSESNVGGVDDLSVCILTADPGSVAFGEFTVADVTGPIEESVTLRNDGDGDCQIFGLQVSGVDLSQQDTAFGVTALGSVLIPPGGETTFVAWYLPETAASDSAVAVIDSNDPETPQLEVPLTGSGQAPVIDVNPAEFDFGSMYIGCDNSQALTITNVGNDALVVDSFQFNTAGTDLAFFEDPDSVNGELPWTLAPGATADVWVDYAPLDEYQDTSYLYINSNDPAAPSYLTTQVGSAELYGLNLDLFEQPINGATDIIFALDWSCSMYDDLANVQSNFGTFVTTLAAMDADYHVAAVVADDGCIVGSSPYVDNTMSLSDQESLFETHTCFDYGGSSCPLQGSNTERAFMLLESALSNSNIKSGGCNEGFYRETATLSLIGVSDEPEQSVNPYTYYVSLFQGMKSDTDDVIMHAIGGDYPSGCGGNSAYTSFYEATVATGGLFLSICATDFGSHLETLAEGSAADLTAFELTDFPVPETILVRVDGVPSAIGWVYVPGTNSVDFEEDYVPEGGSTIEIEYALYGDCES